MASGDGLGLFFNLNMIPCGPPAPPPPEVGPLSPSTFVSGTANSGPGIVSVAKPSGVAVGDIIVASINRFNNNAPFPGLNSISSIGSYLPPGWMLIRDDLNPSNGGSSSGPMYSGLAYKVAGASEPASYTFDTSSGGLYANVLNITLVAVHNSGGIEHTAATLATGPGGHVTAAGVQCDYGIELVLVIGLYGTGSGSVITSDSHLSPAFTPPGQQSNAPFYKFVTSAGVSASEGLSCTNTLDAFTGYQVSMTPG